MDKRFNEVVRLLQICHILFLFAVIITASVALFFNYRELVIEYESKQFIRRILKISSGFVIGIIGSHLIPYLFYWRRMKKLRFGKRVKKFFNGSLVQMSLLFILSICLAVIFFSYPHFFVMAYFAILFVILLAKRPNHFRLYEKTKMIDTNT